MSEKAPISLFFPKLFSVLLFIISIMISVLFFMAQFYAAAVFMALSAPICIARFLNLTKNPPNLQAYDVNSLVIYFFGTLAFFAAGQDLTGFLCAIVCLLKLLTIEVEA